MKILIAFVLVVFGSHSMANDFSFSFDWGDLKSCRSGSPNTVKNPVFYLENVPQETTWIYFKMTDKNARSYRHGGGWVKYEGKNTINREHFNYKSPCPPGGVHEYEWTATAFKDKNKKKSNRLSTSKASRKYPE
jgi:phosphatidylethanolamine-binding protein (PEBP) family uncharacterized protein